MHLLLPFAVGSEPASKDVLRRLALPNLTSLLSRLQAQGLQALSAHSPVLPHEQVLALALGWPTDQPLPWAARHAAGLKLPTDNLPYAFITPCHWQVGTAQVQMHDPALLNLQEDESRALMAAIQPYAQEDGITLRYEQPTRWLASGEMFRDLKSASVERVLHQDLADWMPASSVLRRLQNEMQMLLFTHPVNDARSARRVLPVNSFWVSGSGVLPASTAQTSDLPVVAEALIAPALAQDWTRWGEVWQELDASTLAPLLQAVRNGEQAVQLTLCGDAGYVTFSSEATPPAAWRQAWRQVQSLWQASPWTYWLETL
jgi:hypothetical protein